MASGVTNQMPSQASFGRDRTVVYRRQGGVCRRVWGRAGARHAGGRPASCVGSPRRIGPFAGSSSTTRGVGGGVTDRLREQPIRGGGVRVVAFQGGARPGDQARFANAVTEAWWTLAEALRAEDVDPGRQSGAPGGTLRGFSQNAGLAGLGEPHPRNGEGTRLGVSRLDIHGHDEAEGAHRARLPAVPLPGLSAAVPRADRHPVHRSPGPDRQRAARRALASPRHAQRPRRRRAAPPARRRGPPRADPRLGGPRRPAARGSAGARSGAVRPAAPGP